MSTDQECRRVLASDPAHFDAHHVLGLSLLQTGRLREADRSIRRATDLQPHHPAASDAFGNRATVLLELGRTVDATASLRKALALSPSVGALHFNYANTRRAGNDAAEALRGFERALSVIPRYAPAMNNRGMTLQDLGRNAEAIASFDAVIADDPEHFNALSNRGYAFEDTGRLDKAQSSFEAALAVSPDHLPSLAGRANLMFRRARYAEAAASWARLVCAEPDYPFATGYLLHSRRYNCDWRSHERIAAKILGDIERGKQADGPFGFLSLTDSAKDQLRCASLFVGNETSSARKQRAAGRREDRLRIAYVSGDFREHAVSYLMAGVFERHDRRRFEITALSLGASDGGPTGARVKAAFDRFVDVRSLGDDEIADLTDRLGIDIAVDLMGHTGRSRRSLFARRIAPIQVNYLGYPGTTGMAGHDYILADAFVVPDGSEVHYRERVARLPESFQANDADRRLSPLALDRRGAGLPEGGIVFCCFCAGYKISPDLFDLWMRLLKAVDGSVLWLIAGSDLAVRNLRAATSARGVDPRRLVFAGRLDYADHLARYRLADLFLDTFPFNGGATSSDALWGGLPILTCAGRAFASRMTGSLLHAVGLPELIATDLGGYEALALALARSPSRLADLKARLAAGRGTAPLFDTRRFVAHLEAAYETMWQRHLGGHPPAGFDVPPIARAQ